MLFSTWLRSWKTALARSRRGNVLRRDRTSPRPRFRVGVELLEERMLLSTAVISGPSTAADTAFGKDTPPYTLHLIASEPASQWTIDWGDGTVQTVSGNPSEVMHPYTTGQVVRNISATAVINGQTVVANTSNEGTDLGAFGQIPSGVEMTFGPDITGDGAGDMYVMVWNPNLSAPYLAAYDGMTGAYIKDLCPIVGNATDLKVGPDGDLYWSRSDTASVQRYDFATNSVSTFVSAASGGITSPGALAFGHDANGDGKADLYVCSSTQNVNGPQLIYRYDGTTGQFIDSFSTGLWDMQDIAFGPNDGNLYITRNQINSVMRYDFATGTTSTFVPMQSHTLYHPSGLAFGPDGDLYVSSQLDTNVISYGSWRVLHYDGTTGAYLSTISGWGRTDRGESISSLAFGPDNNLYTAWTGASPVLTTSGTDAPSFVQRLGGPLTPAVSTTLPVTVLKTYQKTYSNTKNTAIPDLKSISSTITVPDSGQVLDVNVKLNITEQKDSDLVGRLDSPSGSNSILLYADGGSGSNFTNTVLDDEAPGGTFIDTATAPFTGTFRPSGDLSNLDGGQAKGTWTLGLSDQVKGGKGTLNNWSLTVTYGIGPAALSASSEVTDITAPTLTDAQVQPLVQEAAARWQAAGLTPQQAALLQNVNVQIADLSGATLGMASGNTIWLDDNAAGWGWFVDATPQDDSEFTTPGDQGEQGHMDLLTVLTHEMGHLLGLEHSSTSGDVMDATLSPGVRLMPTASDLPGGTLAGFSPSHSDDTGKAHPHSRSLPASSHALDATDALFSEWARRTQGA